MFNIPSLEILEDRNSTSGIVSPQIDMVYLVGAPSGSLNNQIQAANIGTIVSTVSLQQKGNINNTIELGLWNGSIPYHGTNTVIIIFLPPGQTAGAGADTSRELLSFLGGQVPVAIVPSVLPNYSPFPGAFWELESIKQGWYTQDAPGIDNWQAIPPGPGGSLKAPNFVEGELGLLLLTEYVAFENM